MNINYISFLNKFENSTYCSRHASWGFAGEHIQAIQRYNKNIHTEKM